MIRFAVSALFLFPTLSLWGTDPDPSRLKPTPEQIARAEELSQQLGNDNFMVRDRASRELAAMGRLALTVIERTLAETTSAEVRSRCEALRPMMQQEDVKARLAVFLADKEGKYDHKLPGWSKFCSAVGKSEAARKLFSEIYEHGATARLMMMIDGPPEEFTRAINERKVEMYNRMYGRVRGVVGANGIITQAERQPPSPAEVAGILLCEGLNGSVTQGRVAYSINSMLLQPPTRDRINDAVMGEPLRKLIGYWADTRTDVMDVYQAMTVTATLNLKEASATKLAKKVLDAKVTSPIYHAYAMSTLARLGGKDELGTLEKRFGDTTAFQAGFVNANGVFERSEMQLRDVALAMCILLSEKKPEDYGFVAGNNRAVGDTVKFNYTTWRLPSDEARTAAFKKWQDERKK